mmetsp:Transcript_36518/g.83922  ORF Transcript_36518/g.83922 Transcript_36518/m.83922 type:complete len:342 (-) Transcript_36518:151-1176(-)
MACCWNVVWADSFTAAGSPMGSKPNPSCPNPNATRVAPPSTVDSEIRHRVSDTVSGSFSVSAWLDTFGLLGSAPSSVGLPADGSRLRRNLGKDASKGLENAAGGGLLRFKVWLLVRISFWRSLHSAVHFVQGTRRTISRALLLATPCQAFSNALAAVSASSMLKQEPDKLCCHPSDVASNLSTASHVLAINVALVRCSMPVGPSSSSQQSMLSTSTCKQLAKRTKTVRSLCSLNGESRPERALSSSQTALSKLLINTARPVCPSLAAAPVAARASTAGPRTSAATCSQICRSRACCKAGLLSSRSVQQLIHCMAFVRSAACNRTNGDLTAEAKSGTLASSL